MEFGCATRTIVVGLLGCLAQAVSDVALGLGQHAGQHLALVDTVMLRVTGLPAMTLSHESESIGQVQSRPAEARMTVIAWIFLAYCTAATLLHLTTVLLVLRRCSGPRAHYVTFDPGPGVTIIRPVCGVDDIERATLAPTFKLNARDVEVRFCQY